MIKDILVYIALFTPTLLYVGFLLYKYGYKEMKFPIFTTVICLFFFYVAFVPTLNLILDIWHKWF